MSTMIAGDSFTQANHLDRAVEFSVVKNTDNMISPCSSFPHGGWVLTGLILSCIAALSATMYGVGSCRFLYVDFESDRGGFGEFYLDPTPDNTVVKYRAAAGLFTWLVPFDDTDWSDGSCAGYTDRQKDNFSDEIFEVSRIFGVLSVLGGIGMTAWTLFLSCLSLRKLQIWAMSLGLFLLTCFVGFTFLLFQSSLCNDLVSYQNASNTTKCTLDQGGLVAIAACILWCVAFLISVIYIKPPENDLMFSPDGKLMNAFQERQLERERLKREKRRLKEHAAEERKAKRGETKSSQASLSHGTSVDMMEDGTAEVQLGDHRGRTSSKT